MPLDAVHPLSPARWDDFAGLFRTDSICRGCWCAYFRTQPAERKAVGARGLEQAFRSRVEAGPPPGLLGYRKGEAVGWLAIGPRADTPGWNAPRRVSRPAPDAPATDPSVWAATCFFVRKNARGDGVTAELLDAGIAFARAQGARLLEACPLEHNDTRSHLGLFVGPRRIFDRCGFAVVAVRKAGRPLMRLVLGAPATS